MDLSSLAARARGAWVGLRHPGSTKRPVGSGESLVPPPCPDGSWVGPPDFVGLGVMKAGTSWWYRLIASHPGVDDVPDRPKELHYFDRFVSTPFAAADIEAYHEFFPRSGGLVGEWTPRYLNDFWTPQLLVRAAPDVRCLVMLRDPVERFLSGITHEISRGGRPNLRLINEHVARGHYPEQLRRLWRWVDRDRTLVLQYERCVDDPAAALAQTYRFLGLDADHVPEGLDRVVNPTRFDKAALPPAVMSDLAADYRADLEQMSSLVPDLDQSRWTSTARTEW